jgi:putative oxidoreductase
LQIRLLKCFLFPSKIDDTIGSAGILILRVIFGKMLILGHGWGKMMNFGDIAPGFMGGSFDLGLAVFTEIFCVAGVVVGLLQIIALIPLIINMSIAFFVAHGAVLTGQGNGESALIYLTAYVCLFLTGSGKYSVDRFIANNYIK